MVSRRGWQKKKRKTKAAMENSGKRDLERAGTNGEEWKTNAEDRGRWRELTTKVEESTK